MNKMVVANLVHRPIRSLISIVAVALEVALILLIAGLAYGIMNDTKGRQAGVGADVIVQPPGATNLAAIGGAPVSIKVADILRKLPHVSVVSPVIWQLSTAGALEVIVDPAPTVAPAPMRTGATIMVPEPMNAPSSMKVGHLLAPS